MGRHSRDVMNRVEGFHPVSRCWLMEDPFIDFIGTSKKSPVKHLVHNTGVLCPSFCPDVLK